MKRPKTVHFDEDDTKSPPSNGKQQKQNRKHQSGGDGFTNFSAKRLKQIAHRHRKSRESLPIWSAQKELKKVIDSNDNVIIVGATGSGKSTQIPQFLKEWGYSSPSHRIGITQPRRVAAISVAQRVAEEVGSNVGDAVGYHIRFDKTEKKKKTEITFLTDGMLLRECVLDKELRKYGVIVLDEAHERTLNTDILFGLIKRIQSARHDTKSKLKVIVMSATLQSSKFAKYFYNAEVFNVRGRTFAVETLYLSKPETNYLDAALTAVLQIHLDAPSETANSSTTHSQSQSQSQSDILVFLTGRDEIEALCRMLKLKAKLFSKQNMLRLLVVPLYASLSNNDQHTVFKPTPNGYRKVVVATNIAETSITIPGIGYVVDSGKVKRRTFDPLSGIDIFSVENISKEEAWQRTGRAGRTSKGHCFRLYTESHFENELVDEVIPDILRSNLCGVILQLKWIGIHDLLSFDLVDKPAPNRILDALGRLITLGAVDADTQRLTPFGEKMSVFPLDPAFSRILLCAQRYKGIEGDVLMMIAMLSVDGTIFVNDSNKRRGGDDDEDDVGGEKRWTEFASKYGDHFTMLNVMQSFMTARKSRNHSEVRKWCVLHGLNPRSMDKALRIHSQLKMLYEANVRSIDESDAYNTIDADDELAQDQRTRDLVQCLLEGLFTNIAYYDIKLKKYKTYSNGELVDIHPTSLMFQKKPQCVLYSSMVKTKNTVWLKDVTEIEDEHLIDDIMPRLKGLIELNVKYNLIGGDGDGDGENDGDNDSAKRHKKGKAKNKESVKEGKKRKAKDNELKPGRAVKRMHEVFDNINSGKFDLEKNRKKKRFKEQHGMNMEGMMMMNMQSFNMMNHRNGMMMHRRNGNNFGQRNGFGGRQHGYHGKGGRNGYHNGYGRGRGRGRGKGFGGKRRFGRNRRY